ncbi:MAG: hypothetical protein HY689_07515 [Chloroflexi bacterium]|nr:hypothetical protein [Chloroflexota bacterium]
MAADETMSSVHVAPAPIPAPPNFPVTWERPDDERLFWTHFRMHYPRPVTPMTYAFSFHHAFNLAAAHYELPIRVDARRINTYYYWSVFPGVPLDEIASYGRRAEAKLGAAVGRLRDLWETEWLPQVRQHLAFWDSFDRQNATLPALLAHLDETLERFTQAWTIHFDLVFPMYLAMSLFEELYQEVFPDGGAAEAYRLLQGFGNTSVETDRALWELSRKALASPEVRQTIQEHPPGKVLAALPRSPAGQVFLGEIQAYLSVYGRRSTQYIELAEPGWIEDPAPVIESLKGYITQPDRDLVAEQAALSAERERLVAAARAHLHHQPEPVRAQFATLLSAAQAATVISEDHTFWIDYGAMHRVRLVLLEFGRRFAEAGVLDQPNDIFYLTLDEVQETAAALPSLNRRQLAGARRAEMEYFRTIQPPPALGTLPPGPPPSDPFGRAIGKLFGAPPEPPTTPQAVRGTAASRGIARGTARVVRSLAEAGKLQPGDILVTETTMPPWTPLFAIAAAVVTDTGGVLSHCAIVAREYGIPAVVGTGNATSAIQDGQTIEVDGATGMVRIL